MVKVKICGITNEEDALIATHMGADALGFIFAPSPRRITPLKAKKIIEILPPFIEKVGVFVNEDISRVKEIAEFCQLSCLQFHGEESPEYCNQFTLKVIKSFSINNEVPPNMTSYKADAYLLDTYSEIKKGGTGKIFNWDVALKVKEFNIPLILSGGLTSDNVKEAVEKVKPYAVDVASGVEIWPGKKSEEKIRKFILNAKGII